MSLSDRPPDGRPAPELVAIAVALAVLAQADEATASQPFEPEPSPWRWGGPRGKRASGHRWS